MNKLGVWAHQIKAVWTRMGWDQRLSLSFEGVIAGATILYVIVALLQRSTMTRQLTQMQQSNKTTKEAFLSVQRAFIYFSDIDVGRLVDKPGGQVVFYKFTTHIINGGATPAKDTYVFRDWKAMQTFPENFQYSEDPLRLKYSGEILGPKAAADVRPIVVPIADLYRVLAHEEEIRFWLTARYHDIFEGTPEHVTKECVEIVVAGDLQDISGKNSDFAFRSCGTHNCVDEECNSERVKTSALGDTAHQ